MALAAWFARNPSVTTTVFHDKANREARFVAGRA
jgi:hypothetical protein